MITVCGRFYLEPQDPLIQDLMEQVNRSPLAERFRGRYARQPVPAAGEILPSAIVPVIALSRKRERKAFPMRWGFSMGEAGRGGSRLVINARSETAPEKPMFRESWTFRRCVIPASWYFEWEHVLTQGGRKKAGQKYAVRSENESMLWLAGLYRMEEGLPVFTVLTREPAESVSWMHDRMPLILPESEAGLWILPDTDPEAVQRHAVTALKCEKAEPDQNDKGSQGRNREDEVLSETGKQSVL
ncbi:MAG: SOS response-associated peptidase [Clostridia bacterium]|nr:SOS response-associated peptidase [Clostridia bacterium]